MDTKTAQGTKLDNNKNRYDLVPGDALDEVVAILTYGAQKYESRNWERGIKWGRVFAAAMRHLWAWWRGEDLDPETGRSHLAHAACCVLFLLAYTLRRQTQFDDRPGQPAAPTKPKLVS